MLSHVYSWPEVRRGGERYLHELSAALIDAGHRVTVVSSSERPGRSQVYGVPVVRLRRRHVPFRGRGHTSAEVAFAGSAAMWVAPRSWDVWHALGPADAAAACLLAKAHRLRSVYTVLGVPRRSYHDDRPDRLVHEFVVNHVDEYVCLSRAASEALVNGWGRRTSVVGGGVDTRRFTPADQRNRKPTLLYSGSFDAPHKNLPFLLTAMDHVLAKVPEAEVWLSGQGSPDNVLAGASARVRSAVRVLDTGDEAEQGRRYAAAWVTVLASTDEAFGLCLVESLACGTPIVVRADSGGPAELVAEGSGLVSGPTPEEYAATCVEALELAAQPSTSGACRVAAMQHDWRSGVVPRLERVYGI